MRAILLVLAVLLAAGCGRGDTESGAGSPTASVEQEPTGSLPQDEPSARMPPPLELVSEAGRQRAAQGSYCIDDPETGVGQCVDYEAPVGPEQLSVVRPGEAVTIAFVGADAVRGSASVRRLGCDEELVSIPLEPETRWEIELEPGAYEVAAVAVVFQAGRASGDTSGVLGVVVDATAPLEVRPAGPPVTCEAG